MAPRGKRSGPVARTIPRFKREAEPACKGAERVYLRVAVRRNADDAERASCVARKGRPVASALVGERVITKKGVFGIVQGHANRHLAIDPKDGALFVGVGSSGNIGVEPEIKASIQRSVELPRQSSATSRTTI